MAGVWMFCLVLTVLGLVSGIHDANYLAIAVCACGAATSLVCFDRTLK